MANNGNGKINWPLYNFLSVVAVGTMVMIGAATDTITTKMLLDSVSELGLPGIILVLWYVTNRTNQRNVAQYHADVLEMRQMYENNVKLVERYADLAGDLKDVLIMNTQAMTEVCNDIKNNVFCPVTRRGMGDGYERTIDS